MKRPSISKRTRYAIFARDQFTCRYCGRQSDVVALVIDHMIPVVQGGTNDPENLITACEDCNQGKAAKRIEQHVPTEEDRLRLSQERNEQRRAAESAAQAMQARREFHNTVVDLWCDVRGTEDVDRRTIGVIVRYAQQHGISLVADWIAIAHERLPWAKDYKVGMYVSGIRRRLIADGEIDPGDATQ